MYGYLNNCTLLRNALNILRVTRLIAILGDFTRHI